MSDTEHASKGRAPKAERHAFSAEVGRLLDLVVHALYSDREIFLRELVANAADATDKRRFDALTESALALPDGASIRVIPDKAAKTLTVSDDGIGMTRDELAQNLGTIARSGTKAFGEKLNAASPEDRPSLIGQFGVGFYAAFMVADRVEVTSRKAGSDEAWTWSSDGKGAYTLAPARRDAAGTDIVLQMKDDAQEFLDAWRLRSIIRKWADHISWPVTLRESKEDGTTDDTPANEGTALWRKPKSDITPEQYAEFYHHVAHAFDEPYATLHWHAEGTTEFTALLFFPGMRPFDFMEQSRESRIHLHVKRMFITDEASLLPSWLRFVQGVVDTEDLPLNVSREMLQATPVLARIRKAVTKRVLTEIKDRAKKAEADFNAFWENFGAVIKEGLWEDAEYRQEIAAFARFHSAKSDGLVTLDDYVAQMKPGQDVIYYLTGDTLEALRASAQLEGFQARGLDVLLLTDPVDGFWPERLNSYQDKVFRSVSQAHGDLEKFALDQEEESVEPAQTEALIPALKDALGEAVKDVRSTVRLTGSAVVITSEGGPDRTMQRLMRRSGQAVPEQPPILEINPRHPLIRTLAERAKKGESVADYARILLDIARVQEGETLPDPSGFARVLAGLLARAPGEGPS